MTPVPLRDQEIYLRMGNDDNVVFVRAQVVWSLEATREGKLTHFCGVDFLERI